MNIRMVYMPTLTEVSGRQSCFVNHVVNICMCNRSHLMSCDMWSTGDKSFSDSSTDNRITVKSITFIVEPAR